MDLLEAIEKRHSVRQYNDKKIEGDIKKDLLEMEEEDEQEYWLNIPKALKV